MIQERDYQSKLIKRLHKMLPGSIVLKSDPNHIQGIPDLLVLYKDKWAALEVKRCETALRQPNQEHYVSVMDNMSFARFVYPENEEVVLDELQSALAT